MNRSASTAAPRVIELPAGANLHGVASEVHQHLEQARAVAAPVDRDLGSLDPHQHRLLGGEGDEWLGRRCLDDLVGAERGGHERETPAGEEPRSPSDPGSSAASARSPARSSGRASPGSRARRPGSTNVALAASPDRVERVAHVVRDHRQHVVARLQRRAERLDRLARRRRSARSRPFSRRTPAGAASIKSPSAACVDASASSPARLRRSFAAHCSWVLSHRIIIPSRPTGRSAAIATATATAASRSSRPRQSVSFCPLRATKIVKPTRGMFKPFFLRRGTHARATLESPPSNNNRVESRISVVARRPRQGRSRQISTSDDFGRDVDAIRVVIRIFNRRAVVAAPRKRYRACAGAHANILGLLSKARRVSMADSGEAR